MNLSGRYTGPPRGDVHTHHHGNRCAKDLMPGDRGYIAHSGITEQDRTVSIKRNGGWYKVDPRHIDQVQILGEHESAEPLIRL